MNTLDSAVVLGMGANGGVVQLPGRAFPGLVIQGDSLSILTKQILEIRKVMNSKEMNKDEMLAELDDVVDKLQGRMIFYEKILEQHGISLPYNKKSE